MLRKMAPAKLVQRLVTQDLTINRTAVTLLARSGVLTKRTLEEIAIRVIREYKASYKEEVKAGSSKSAAVKEALAGKRLMVQRVQNAVVNKIAKEIKSQYRGDYYTWLPSDAEVPDPLHQLNYGKKFQLGKGEAPGDRYGCKCGMEIHTDDTRLEL